MTEIGFDWFGHGPAHEALTAYGILELRDISAVFDIQLSVMYQVHNVKMEYITRAEQYLLSRRRI